MNEKVIIHPVELKRRRGELMNMIIFNEEVKKKVIQFPKKNK
jgi:hypothetical protein